MLSLIKPSVSIVVAVFPAMELDEAIILRRLAAASSSAFDCLSAGPRVNSRDSIAARVGASIVVSLMSGCSVH